jgi:hypothetical protein
VAQLFSQIWNVIGPAVDLLTGWSSAFSLAQKFFLLIVTAVLMVATATRRKRSDIASVLCGLLGLVLFSYVMTIVHALYS